MLRTKGILTEICNSTESGAYNLTQDDLERLQNHLIRMYRDIETVCKRHNLGICLAYGNVLGAVRHDGWIPWDDDLDIHMSREDYELLLTKYASELPGQYKVSSYHTPEGSHARFAKILDTTTVFVPLGGEKDENSCVFIDIFPIDNCPTSGFLNKLRKGWAFFLMYTATSVAQFQTKSSSYKKLMWKTKEGRMNWRFRNIWGMLFSFAKSQSWNKWIEDFATYQHVTGKVHVMSALSSSFNPQPLDMYFPFKEIQLKGIGKVHVPNKAEEYLSFTYGSWRKIPKLSDQWHHWVTEFYIP